MSRTNRNEYGVVSYVGLFITFWTTIACVTLKFPNWMFYASTIIYLIMGIFVSEYALKGCPIWKKLLFYISVIVMLFIPCCLIIFWLKGLF